MKRKNNLSVGQSGVLLQNLTMLILIATTTVSAQVSPKNAAGENTTWLYVLLAAATVVLAGAVMWFLKSKKQNEEIAAKKQSAEVGENSDRNSVDAEKEMEWLRKNQKLIGKRDRQPLKKKDSAKIAEARTNSSQTNSAVKINNNEANAESIPALVNKESKEFMPIFAIRRLEQARPFHDLPLSNDESLRDAVEQTYDEMEEDTEVRELAVRILAAFKTRNSVEALTQVALYDLLSNLRSKAVTVLCEFDHESVFEPILLACADPTREVRAAAARGLTKLTFDRADAWTRIAELDAEEGRMVAAARAAVESGFVDMSFDRLVHQDRKYAYEAFALMALLIKAGETEKIFNALENHRDMNVRRAILHTIKITKDQKALEGLYNVLENGNLPIEFQEEVDRTIEEIGYVTA